MKEFLNNISNFILSVLILCFLCITFFIIGVSVGKAIVETSNYLTGYKQAMTDFNIIKK